MVSYLPFKIEGMSYPQPFSFTHKPLRLSVHIHLSSFAILLRVVWWGTTASTCVEFWPSAELRVFPGKMTAQEQMRKMLDELMGTKRDGKDKIWGICHAKFPQKSGA